MSNLRPYQAEAVSSIFRYFENNDGHPIVCIPTGGGKSHVLSEFIAQTLEQWPRERFLILSHVREILLQDADKLPLMGVGFYSAGLGRRDTDAQITLASIQSIYQRAHEIGDISIVVIDECHLVSPTSETMYRSFLADITKLCPSVRVIGLSATPYRLDSGSLIKGKQRLFTDICYNAGIKDLIDQGYLSPLVSAHTRNHANTSNVKKRGGEFVTGDLEQLMNQANITEPALDEVESLCADRKSWIVFCVGVDHARDVAQAMRMRGWSTEVVVGDTPKIDREQRLAAFKAGKVRALVSVGVLTTGFDAPNADALICLRPTKSPGLWVQMVGRIARLSTGKVNGMVVDFTNNTYEHGPIDLITCDKSGDVKTCPYHVCPMCGKLIEPKAKACACGYSFERECAKCHALFDRDLKQCPDCGHWIKQVGRKIDHNTEAADGEILSGEGDNNKFYVVDWSFTRHTKEGKPDSLKVTYWDTMMQSRSEWVCLEHGGYAGEKASSWWWRRCGKAPTPTTVGEALGRTGELKCPTEITIKKEGKYWRVL